MLNSIISLQTGWKTSKEKRLNVHRTISKISHRDDHVNNSAIEVQDIAVHEKKKIGVLKPMKETGRLAFKRLCF
jgi:hypothetical protein